MAASRKIVKEKNVKPDAFEESVAQAMTELENSGSELRHELRELQITGAKEIETAGKKAVVISIPYRQVIRYKRIQVRLIRELEKKFSGKHVVFVAQRRMLKPVSKNDRRPNKQMRPRSRTLTAVHDAILDDVVYPTEIVGRRTRTRLDGTRLVKIHLAKKDQQNTEHKLETFAGVYKKLTGKEVEFMFPSNE
jgi:small subunit ribosomal protein S7e